MANKNKITVIVSDDDYQKNSKQIMSEQFEPTTQFKIIREHIAAKKKIDFSCFLNHDEYYDEELDNEELGSIMKKFKFTGKKLEIAIESKDTIHVIVTDKSTNEEIMNELLKKETTLQVIKDKIIQSNNNQEPDNYKLRKLRKRIPIDFDKIHQLKLSTLINLYEFSNKSLLEIYINCPDVSNAESVELRESDNQTAVVFDEFDETHNINLINTKKDEYTRYPLFIGFGLHTILFWISFGLQYFSSKKFKNRQIIHFFSLYVTETILTLFIVLIYFIWLKKWEYNKTFGFLILCMLFYVILTPFIFESILKNGKVITQKNHNYFHALNGLIYTVCVFIISCIKKSQ